MICILHGHRLVHVPGTGQHAGKVYLVCAECGETKGEVDRSEAASRPIPLLPDRFHYGQSQ